MRTIEKMKLREVLFNRSQEILTYLWIYEKKLLKRFLESVNRFIEYNIYNI